MADVEYLTDIAALEAHYGTAQAPSLRKVADRLTPEYRAWIAASRFVVLSTVGPEGTDGTPRGDDGPVVIELDPQTLALPDWNGNNRIDSLRNIVRDGRVSLMFMVPGSSNVVRVNGTARITADEPLRQRFARNGNLPRTVAVIRVSEVYFQCSRALMRSGMWARGDKSEGLPTPGQMLAAMTDGEVGGPDYDRAWPERAESSMW
ncbi:MAG: pyridoxamine 5'-phosphate oxidase family protein [Rhodobacteraceae bacterium]|nr:pyridoxamine 5'-phosphate oxidase family protein [Paracoccaceae bacterium]